MRTQRNTTAKPVDTTPGFAIKLTADTEFRLAMLICEDEDGQYEPVAVSATINEAKELALHHFYQRRKNTDSGICPYIYKLWANGIDGGLRVAFELDPMDYIELDPEDM